MAIHSLESEDLKDFQSANAYRLELERMERERYARELAAEAEREAKQMIKPMEKMAMREIRGAIKDDDISREIRGGWMGTSAVANVMVGMALVVASTAAEASYNKAMLDAQRDSDKLYKDEAQRIIRENMDNSVQTLTQMVDRTEETRRELESTQKAYYVEYQDTRAEAQRVMESAKRDYEKEMQELNKETRRIDSEHKREAAAIQASLDPLQKTRDAHIESSKSIMESEIKAAENRYAAEERRIRSEYHGADIDKELQKAALRREEQTVRAQQAHANNVQRYTEEYNRQAEPFASQLDEINKRRNAERENVINRGEDAKTRRDTAINHQNDVIKESQIKYAAAVKEARGEFTNEFWQNMMKYNQ